MGGRQEGHAVRSVQCASISVVRITRRTAVAAAATLQYTSYHSHTPNADVHRTIPQHSPASCCHAVSWRPGVLARRWERKTACCNIDAVRGTRMMTDASRLRRSSRTCQRPPSMLWQRRPWRCARGAGWPPRWHVTLGEVYMLQLVRAGTLPLSAYALNAPKGHNAVHKRATVSSQVQTGSHLCM